MLEVQVCSVVEVQVQEVGLYRCEVSPPPPASNVQSLQTPRPLTPRPTQISCVRCGRGGGTQALPWAPTNLWPPPWPARTGLVSSGAAVLAGALGERSAGRQ